MAAKWRTPQSFKGGRRAALIRVTCRERSIENRENELGDPRFARRARAGHVERLNAVHCDEAPEGFSRPEGSGMNVNPWLVMLLRKPLCQRGPATAEGCFDADYYRAVRIQDVPLCPSRVVGRGRLL